MSKGTPFFLLEQQATESGAAAAGAKLYFYRTGTTTDQSVYQESTLDTTHSQPVVADANGVFDDIWLNPDATNDYRVKLTDSDDNLIWQIDGVPRYRENFESGTYTVSYTGFSSDPAATTATWYRIGRLVMLELPVGDGTSNAQQFSMEGLPDALIPDVTQYGHIPFVNDNSAHVTGGAVAQIGTNGVITFALGSASWDADGWTSSGSKGLSQFAHIMYMLRDS